MSLVGANALKELNKIDYRILTSIERGMITREFVPIDDIAKMSKYTVQKVEYVLKKCHKLDLVHRWSGHYVGYELTIHGYDALALNTLYERGVITSFGRERGVGKESRVFYALTPEDREIVIKLHRVGFTSFHQVKKKRRYTANKKHISELYASRLSAESEVSWLKLANKLELPVPEYIDSNRHAIALELILGENLNKLRHLEEPIDTLDILLESMKIMWQKGEFVHGDFSEHNIIMNQEGIPIIIDFPQAVESYSPSGDELLQRDIHNILVFFKKKFGLILDPDVVYEEIKGSVNGN